jgi:hypothetical protein
MKETFQEEMQRLDRERRGHTQVATQPPQIKPIVFVAIYKPSKGAPEVRVFEVEDHAWNWRKEIAEEQWARCYTDEPDDVANEYFDRAASFGETFTVEDCEVE